MSKEIRSSLLQVVRYFLVLLLPTFVWFLAVACVTQSVPTNPLFYEILLCTLLILACIVCLITEDLRNQNRLLEEEVVGLEAELMMAVEDKAMERESEGDEVQGNR